MIKPGATPLAAPEPYVSRIDRRTTLAWLAGASAVGLSGAGVAAQPADKPVYPTPGGYGLDPNLKHPVSAPWPRLLSGAELQTSALLCDFILPASPEAPSAASLGVPDFIDEWISAPYPTQTADRPIILSGLRELQAQAQTQYRTELFHIDPAVRLEFFGGLARRPTDAGSQKAHIFFRRFRALTIGAYYTTKPGFKDIGYIGNVPHASFPPPSEAVKAHLERELKKLGL